jgi:hypothetical protein
MSVTTNSLTRKINIFLKVDSDSILKYSNLRHFASAFLARLLSVKMNRGMLLIAWSMLIQLNLFAQGKAGIEQYSYIGAQSAGAIVPSLHLQSASNWYGELRYNYEDLQTCSLYGGRIIEGGNDLEYSITPMLGFSAGWFTGISLATNAEAEWKNFYLSSQTQHSIAIKEDCENFFFSWSELGYNVSDHFFAGLAMQYTLQMKQHDFEPGFLAGLNFKNFSFPFYVFSPFHSGRYFILGVNYEYNFKKREK